MTLEQRARGCVKPLGGARLGGAEIGDERPAAARPGLGQLGEARPPALATAWWRAQQAQGREGVVGDLAGPDQVPERVQDHVLVSPTGGGVEVAEEARAAAGQVLADALVDFALGSLGRRRHQPLGFAAQIERHPAVGTAQGAAADPDHLAHGDQLVEEPGPVVADADRQHVALHDRRRQGQALELEDRLQEPV